MAEATLYPVKAVSRCSNPVLSDRRTTQMSLDGALIGWLTCITVDPQAFGAGREAIRVALEKVDIESRPLWKPMHLQPVFQGCEVIGGAVAAALFRDGLCLPSGTAMMQADIERVAAVVRDVGTR